MIMNPLFKTFKEFENKIYIYGLFDDSDSKEVIRYIGKTKNIHSRMTAHCSMSKDYPVNRWIKKLVSEGSGPNVKILDIVEESEWEQAEKDYIYFYRKYTGNLLNIRDGGGSFGPAKPHPNCLGENHYNSKLTEAQVLEIRTLVHDPSAKYSDIAKKFKVSRTLISKIALGKIWKTSSKEVVKRETLFTIERLAKLAESEVEEIKILLASGIDRKDIMNHYHISETTIYDIIYGKRWSHISGPDLSHLKRKILAQSEIIEIRKLSSRNISKTVIAKKFNISWSAVKKIANGSIRGDVEG